MLVAAVEGELNQTAITLLCQLHPTTDVEILPDQQPWLIRYGFAGKPDLIGHESCVRKEWLSYAEDAPLVDIADGNLPEVRRLGTFRVGDKVRYVGSPHCDSQHQDDPSLMLATGIVVDRQQWLNIDAPEGHDVRVHLRSGLWDGHYADFRADELGVVLMIDLHSQELQRLNPPTQYVPDETCAGGNHDLGGEVVYVVAGKHYCADCVEAKTEMCDGCGWWVCRCGCPDER